MVQGFKLTTFGKWVSSHNNKTRAPARPNSILLTPQKSQKKLLK